jgi:hypothetical protein
MTRLPWHRAATNYRRDALDAIALLAARTAERDELRDRLTQAQADNARLRSELSMRASGWTVCPEARGSVRP